MNKNLFVPGQLLMCGATASGEISPTIIINHDKFCWHPDHPIVFQGKRFNIAVCIASINKFDMTTNEQIELICILNPINVGWDYQKYYKVTW